MDSERNAGQEAGALKGLNAGSLLALSPVGVEKSVELGTNPPAAGLKSASNVRFRALSAASAMCKHRLASPRLVVETESVHCLKVANGLDAVDSVRRNTSCEKRWHSLGHSL